MTEIWKAVPEFEEYYEVSNLGRFRSIKQRKGGRKAPFVLKMKLMNDGYLYARLNKNKKQYYKNAHRIVASVFIPNPENKAEVNHKNFDKTDNAVSNLEWVTPWENIQHFLLSGRAKYKILKTQIFAVCHPDRKAVGIDNLCKRCWDKDYRQKNRDILAQKRKIYLARKKLT